MTKAKTIDLALERSAYRSDREYRAARAKAWARALRVGLTMTDIGHAVGISRERVRQILRAEGYDEPGGLHAARPEIDPARVVAALRDKEGYDIRRVAKLSRCTPADVRRVLVKLGRWEEAQRIWRKRHESVVSGERVFTKPLILRALKAFSARNGRAPRISDAFAGRLPFSRTTVLRRFGTWNRAIIAAGLEPIKANRKRPIKGVARR